MWFTSSWRNFSLATSGAPIVCVGVYVIGVWVGKGPSMLTNYANGNWTECFSDEVNYNYSFRTPYALRAISIHTNLVWSEPSASSHFAWNLISWRNGKNMRVCCRNLDFTENLGDNVGYSQNSGQRMDSSIFAVRNLIECNFIVISMLRNMQGWMEWNPIQHNSSNGMDIPWMERVTMRCTHSKKRFNCFVVIYRIRTIHNHIHSVFSRCVQFISIQFSSRTWLHGCGTWTTQDTFCQLMNS